MSVRSVGLSFSITKTCGGKLRCTKSFFELSPIWFDRHRLRKHYEGEIFKCHCQAVYTSQHLLEQHQLIHKKNVKRCHKCRKRFPTLRLLNRHNKTHLSLPENRRFNEINEFYYWPLLHYFSKRSTKQQVWTTSKRFGWIEKEYRIPSKGLNVLRSLSAIVQPESCPREPYETPLEASSAGVLDLPTQLLLWMASQDAHASPLCYKKESH